LKVRTNLQRTGIALHRSKLSAQYKKQYKQMCEVLICGKIICFQHGNRFYFLLSFTG